MTADQPTYELHLDTSKLKGICQALKDVINERKRQDELWGEQNHPEGDWLLILQEEIGEWSQAVLDTRVKGADPKHIREELVQVVAVALSMLEAHDRNLKETS